MGAQRTSSTLRAPGSVAPRLARNSTDAGALQTGASKPNGSSLRGEPGCEDVLGVEVLADGGDFVVAEREGEVVLLVVDAAIS